MSIHGKVKRYYLIIDKVSRGNYPSITVLQSHLCAHGFDIPRRTFVRDLSEIRNEFGVEIVYDHGRRGYFIDRENSLDFDTISQLLQTAISTEALLDNMQSSRKAMNYIDYGGEVELKGMDNFEKLLQSVKENRVITFNHENYNTGTLKPYKLCPYLLKEYQKRWYVIGTVHGTENIRTFGLDRIEEFTMLSEKFKRKESLSPKPFFKDIIGLNYSEYNVEEVILCFLPVQAKYLKAYPLHASQTVVEENDLYTRMKFTLKPNYEFQERVLMYGKNVVVEEPKWLKEKIVETLKDSLKNYS